MLKPGASPLGTEHRLACLSPCKLQRAAADSARGLREDGAKGARCN